VAEPIRETLGWGDGLLSTKQAVRLVFGNLRPQDWSLSWRLTPVRGTLHVSRKQLNKLGRVNKQRRPLADQSGG
jgi:hypothetical protein